MPIRFVHVNVIAKDWRRLAAFYETVFGCQRVLPERDQQGRWLDRVTGIAGSHIQGVHLRLPGGGATLEVYSYTQQAVRPEIKANTPGFSHIAFSVDDVDEISRVIVANGGRPVGEREEVEVADIGRLEIRYLTDPEGNIIEVQKWS
jgi:predicted enzyme related to lactoylglutathione lyase